MISLVVAIAKNNVIGKNNQLPWHYKRDLEYFKSLTLNHTVVMGTNTFKSIIDRNGKILPKRHNVVVTRNPDFHYEGVEVIHDFISYLQKDHQEEIFIIGGSKIFEMALPYAERLYITHINKEYAGDVYFPKLDYSKYQLIQETVDGELTFSVYERK